MDDEPEVAASRTVDELVGAVERVRVLLTTSTELRRHRLAAPGVVGQEREG